MAEKANGGNADEEARLVGWDMIILWTCRHQEDVNVCLIQEAVIESDINLQQQSGPKCALPAEKRAAALLCPGA